MKRFMFPLAFAAMLTASACSSVVENNVAAAEIALTSAERVALIYTSLPRCGGAVKICSDQAAVDKIKDLDMKAYTVVKAAEKDSALLSAAWSAIGRLQGAVPVVAK